MNSAPTANSVNVSVASLGGSQDVQLRTNVSDIDSNLDRCFLDGVTVAPSGGICIFDTGDALANASRVWVNDTGNLNASMTFNFSVVTAGLLGGANPTLSVQVQKRNDTLFNNDSSNALTYKVTHATPSGGSLIQGGTFHGAIAASGNAPLFSNWTGDFLAEAYTRVFQDHSKVTEAGGAIHGYILLNVTSTANALLENVSIAGLCGPWVANETQKNFTALQALTNHNITCNSTNVITKARAIYNLTGPTIVLNVAPSGYLTVNTTNPNNTAFGDVLVNVSDQVPTGWTLNDSETYTLNLSGSGNSTLANSTMKTSTALVINLTPTAAQCLGFTLFGEYCYKESSADQGGGTFQHTSSVRHVINVSDFDRVNVSVENFTVVLPFGLSLFTNWAIRNGGSEIAYVNGSSQNISITSDAVTVNVSIGDNYSSAHGLVPGLYLVDVNYTWTTTTGQSPGGGGGGGSPTFPPEAGAANASFVVTPASWSVPFMHGESRTQEFVLSCTGSEQCVVDLSFACTIQGADSSCNWATFMEGSNALTRKTVAVDPGTVLSPGKKTFNVTVHVPMDVAERVYRFYMVAKPAAGVAARVPIEPQVGTFSITVWVFDLWDTMLLPFENVIFGVTGITVGYVITGVFALVVLVGVGRYLGKKG